MRAPTVKMNNPLTVRRAIQRLAGTALDEGSTPTFYSVKCSGLTASRLVQTNATKVLASVTDLTSWIAGTANEIDITDDGDGTLTIGLVDPLIVAKGGTGAATLTDHGLLVGSGTGAITPLAAATNGQIPIGSTGADPVLAGITGTANRITVTDGAGSITLTTPQDTHTGASPTFVDVTATGDLKSGVDDNTAGNLLLFGSGSGADGGCAKWYTGADHDDSIDYYSWNIDEDDFILKAGTTGKLTLAGDTGNFSSGADWTVNDLTISTPSNIYALSHDSFAGFVADEHIAHSGVSISAGGILSGGGDITASRTITLAHGDVDHDQTLNFVAAEHVSLPNTIANVLSDHDLAAHTALGLFDASADVDHDATTNVHQDVNTAASPTFANLIITAGGDIHIGTPHSGYEAYPFTITDALGGIIFKRTGVNQPFIWILNETANSGGLIRGLNTGGLQFDAGTGATEVMRYNNSGYVSIGATYHYARLLVAQPSTTAAIPSLYLVQADVSEEFIKFVGTAADDTLTQSLVAVADVGSADLAGYFKVYIQDDGNQITDGVYYVPFYTNLVAP